MLDTKLSDDRRYRFTLVRRVSMFGDGVAAWLMLNPSTADEEHDDQTIRRVMSFSAAWGYHDCLVVNLSPLRSPHPSELVPVEAGIHGRNLHEVLQAARWARTMIVAYGAHVGKVDRAAETLEALRATGVPLYCLGRTKEGHPRHPLMVRGDTKLERFDLTGETGTQSQGGSK